jgi:hypothetical protein
VSNQRLKLVKGMQVVRAAGVGDALGRAGSARCETQTRWRVLIKPAPRGGQTAFLQQIFVPPNPDAIEVRYRHIGARLLDHHDMFEGRTVPMAPYQHSMCA